MVLEESKKKRNPAMNTTKPAPSNPDSQPRYGSLDGHYRKIGISAVAAAIRYQGELRNATAAPAFAYDTD